MAKTLATTPGMQPPDGQTSDFNAPYNSLQIGTVIAFGITYFFATCFIGLRYFQAFKLTKKIDLDLGEPPKRTRHGYNSQVQKLTLCL